MKKFFPALVAILSALTLILSSCLFVDLEDSDVPDYSEQSADKGKPTGGDSWAIYWYLCGSDLESNYGAATNDLNEMMSVKLPDNVKVIIQTGGAVEWQNKFVSADHSERYIYNKDGLARLEQNGQANMGDPETLASFLKYCEKNHPADRKAVVFWNHGGGSVAGVEFDDNFNGDSLTLDELEQAFTSAYGDVKEAPLDIIGFDTCLMATVDTAYAVHRFGDYMVGSEEYEPGCGWSYDGWLGALAENTKMQPFELGKHMCDAYIKACDEQGVGDECTLAVINLNKTEPLFDAYESMGAEALVAASKDPGFFGEFGRQAMKTENYGGNTKQEGFTNMIDLGHLAANCADILPESSKAVIDSLKNCVEYKVNGPYRGYAAGLACYYSFNGSEDNFAGYNKIGYGQAFKYLYSYEITGKLSSDAKAYIKNLGQDGGSAGELHGLGDETYPLYIDEEGYVVLEPGEDVLDMIKDINFRLVYEDRNEGFEYMLGTDNDIDADWDKGIFRDNFRAVWGGIDGHKVFMDVCYADEDYTGYAIPILINEKPYNLRVVYDYEEEDYFILGARKGLSPGGIADKNLVKLKPGDKITTLIAAREMNGEDKGFQYYTMDEFTVTEKTKFGEIDLNDGRYILRFEIEDIRNKTAYSEKVIFNLKDGEFEIEIDEGAFEEENNFDGNWSVKSVDGTDYLKFCKENDIDPDEGNSYWEIRGEKVTLKESGEVYEFSLKNTDEGFDIFAGGEKVLSLIYDKASDTLAYRLELDDGNGIDFVIKRD